MTDEEHIRYYRHLRAEAVAVIEGIDKNHIVHFDFEGDRRVNTTAQWRAQKEHEIDCADRLIAAWEKIVAQKTSSSAMSGQSTDLRSWPPGDPGARGMSPPP